MAKMPKNFLVINPHRQQEYCPVVVELKYPAPGDHDKKAGVIFVVYANDTKGKQHPDWKHQELLFTQSEVDELASLTHAKAVEEVRDEIAFQHLTSIDDKKLLKLLDRVHFRRHAETIPLCDHNFPEDVKTLFKEEGIEVLKDITKMSVDRLLSLLNDNQHLNDEVLRTLEAMGIKLKEESHDSSLTRRK